MDDNNQDLTPTPLLASIFKMATGSTYCQDERGYSSISQTGTRQFEPEFLLLMLVSGMMLLALMHKSVQKIGNRFF